MVASHGHDPGHTESSGPTVSRRRVEPRSSQEHSALVPTRSVGASALDGPIQGHCGGEMGHCTAASHQETFPPAPAFGPLPLRLRPEPCCAPSPGTPDRAPVSPTVPRARPLIPCAGAFSRPRGNVESTPTSPGVTGKNRLAWGQRQGSPCCTDIPQGSHELRLMSRPWGGHRSVLPCTLILHHSCSAPSTVWAGLNQPGSEPGHQQLWPQAELSSLCEVDQEPSTGGG